MNQRTLAGRLRHALLGAMLIMALGSTVLPAQDADKATDKDKDREASIIFEGHFPTKEPKEKEPRVILSMRLTTEVMVGEEAATQSDGVAVKVVQGKLKELALQLGGEGEVLNVIGEGLMDWGVRRGTNNMRYLVIHTLKDQQTRSNWNFTVTSRTRLEKVPSQFAPVSLVPDDASLFSGFIRVNSTESLDVRTTTLNEITPIEPKFFPGADPKATQDDRALTFRYSGGAYALSLMIAEADPDLRKIRVQDFNLTGKINGKVASFQLTGSVEVRHPRGGKLNALSGAVALTGFKSNPDMDLVLNQGRYDFVFRTNGVYPIELNFDALISEKSGWQSIDFTPLPSALRPVTLEGLPETTELRFNNAAKAQRQQGRFLSYLPASGPLNVQWQTARPEVEGKLFFAVNGISQVSVSPGLIRQTSILEYRVLQGELKELAITLEGEGEVIQVQGEGILGWTDVAAQGDTPRQLRVNLNQGQKQGYRLIVSTQTPLGAFPLNVKPMRLIPQGAIRFGGHIRVVNAGAVRLEVLNAPGLAQISPARFPETKGLPALDQQQQGQAFAFRFSGTTFDLQIQADNVLPELTVSQLLIYRLGETEATIEAELEVDIREAPLREFELVIPDGYSIAFLKALNLSDRTVGEPDENGGVLLTLQFAQPLLGRQVFQLRLIQNHDSPPATWELFRLQPRKTKSIRGFVGMSADAGLRLAASQTQGLTEIATAFFPKKINELQLAYRVRDPNWTATLQSERLALSIQVDALQLFSVGEGLVYGSSVLNYLISGAPVSMFQVNVPTNYTNVEFVGQDVRNWKQTETGYEVYLHTPVSGTYSLLATYDLPFNPLGEEMAFNGIEPVGVQSEQGHIIVVSAFQFETETVEETPGLLALEPGEVPTEYRLLVDSPVLAAYQFTGRPFSLILKLTSLEQGETVNQVVDRATFRTHVSGEGQVLTEATYLIKTKGQSYLRLVVPENTTLWSAYVNGEKVVPVSDETAMLVRLPKNAPPNTIIPVELKLAMKSGNKNRVQIALPQIDAPILLSDWQIRPDDQYRVDYEGGTVVPIQGPVDVSGFVWFYNMLRGNYEQVARGMLLLAGLLFLVGAAVWRWGTRESLHRFGIKNIAGLLLGVAALFMAYVLLSELAGIASSNPIPQTRNLSFMLPVQAPGEVLSVTVKNRALGDLSGSFAVAWPAYLGLLCGLFFLVTREGLTRLLGIALGWTLVFWGFLRLPNGAATVFNVIGVFAFIQIVVPLCLRQWRMKPRPRKKKKEEPPPATDAATTILIGLLCAGGAWSASAATPPAKPPVIVESVIQNASVEENRVFLDATLKWQAREGQSLDFLRHPAVLVDINYDKNALKLVQEQRGNTAVYSLKALKDGTFTVTFTYEQGITASDGSRGFNLSTHHGLVNRLNLAIDRAEIQLVSSSAISIRPMAVGETATESRFELVLAPQGNTRIAWKPRSRDTSTEQSVYFADLFHLFVPTAGIVEGLHDVTVKPAQGQVAEVVFNTPDNLTITDVDEQLVSGWKFDPDNQRLSVQLKTPHSSAFSLRIYSQITTSPLPFEAAIGLITIEGAAGQVGMVGVGTGTEVQLDAAEPSELTPIPMENFPQKIAADHAAKVGGLTLRRAFRSGSTDAVLTLKASAVQPDISVNSQQTLSLGEDRTVLAVKLNVAITRAGVFKLSFVLPGGMDVESLTGDVMSHWTELSVEGQRIITMHLKGKTTGAHNFAISLAGPGVPAGAGWQVPRLDLREARKQVGQLIVVPEQGMRLQVATREGVNQPDPKEVGIRQKGVRAFRLLQPDWQLSFDIEKVDPWIQVDTLQDVTIREGQIKAVGTFDYKIENAGLKSLFVQLPANAEGVRFTGDQLADAVKSEDVVDNQAAWEIKLRRRIIGNYRLQVNYQMPASEAGQETVIGMEAKEVNVHRPYLTLRTGGRLQLNVPRVPPSLQVVDWRSIPASLRGGKNGVEGSYTFRAIEPSYQITLNVVRHTAERLLAARVEQTDLMSTLSDSGEMLTQARVVLQTGDLRKLEIRLPKGAQFWFAFVNNSGVWPWKSEDRILIPLEQYSKPNQSSVVEFLYSLPTKSGRGNVSDFKLLGPEFNLPLQNITWRVFLPQNRILDDWDGDLQLQTTRISPAPDVLDLQSYINQESSDQQQQTKEAEDMLNIANQYRSRGQQREARQAYQSAWSLSQHDNAFNEDARVQLHNLKIEQALVGLNYRRNAVFQDEIDGAAAATNAAIKILQANQPAKYTQEQVKEALDVNTPEDNNALIVLAENIIRQQDAAQAAPEAIRASLPEHGNQLHFKRSLLVDSMATLSLNLETRAVATSASSGSRLTLLLGLFVCMTVLIILARSRRNA